MSNASESLKMLFSKVEDFVSTKTVVGAPVVLGDVTIIPLMDVSMGIATGVADAKEDKNGKDSGAGGMGAKMTPSAILVINKGAVQLINVKNQEGLGGKLMDMVPGILEKVTGMFGGKDGEKDIDIDLSELNLPETE